MKDNPVVYMVMMWFENYDDGSWVVDEVFIQLSDAEKYISEQVQIGLHTAYDIVKRQTK